MGVPFVTLEGDSMVGRQGVSILKNAGLEEFIAKSKKDYVEKGCIVGTQQRKTRKEFRENCRDRFNEFPII